MIFTWRTAKALSTIEMQVAAKRNLPKRSRYYQGMIDLNSIEKRARYNSLKKSYVIFICIFDPFEKNLPIYNFSNRCMEMPDLELGDETTKVFVNTYGNTKDLAEEIKAFFEFLKEELTQSDFTKKLYEEVEKARENKEWRCEYMAWISELEESREETRKEEREETAISIPKDNMPISKIILYSRLPESRILELQKSLTKK